MGHRGDHQLAGGECRGEGVQRLAQARHEGVVRRREVAADDDRLRVQQVDRRGHHLADPATGDPHQLAGVGVALHGELDQVAHVADLVARRARGLHQRPARGHRLHAAGVAAAAGQPGRGVDLGVADLAGRAQPAAQQGAAGDHPDPEAGRGLDEEQLAVPLEQAAALRERHRVGVVLHEDRGGTRGAGVRGARNGARRTPSQPIMIGESRLAPAVASTVPGMLRPTARTWSGVRPTEARSSPKTVTARGISTSGDSSTSCSRSRAASTVPSRSHTPSWVRLRPMAPASTTPASRSKRSRTGGRPPEDGRRGRVVRIDALRHQTRVEQRLHAGGDGRAGQPGEPADLAAGVGTAVTDQGEDLAGRRGSRHRRHTGIEPPRALRVVYPTGRSGLLLRA